MEIKNRNCSPPIVFHVFFKICDHGARDVIQLPVSWWRFDNMHRAEQHLGKVALNVHPFEVNLPCRKTLTISPFAIFHTRYRQYVCLRSWLIHNISIYPISLKRLFLYPLKNQRKSNINRLLFFTIFWYTLVEYYYKTGSLAGFPFLKYYPHYNTLSTDYHQGFSQWYFSSWMFTACAATSQFIFQRTLSEYSHK